MWVVFGWLELNGHADTFVSSMHPRVLGLVPTCLCVELIVVWICAEYLDVVLVGFLG